LNTLDFFFDEPLFLSLGQFVVTMSYVSTIDNACTKIFSPQTASRGKFSNNGKVLTQNIIHPEAFHN